MTLGVARSIMIIHIFPLAFSEWVVFLPLGKNITGGQ